MSELHFDFDYVRSLDPVRLDFFYKEARRQRTDKAFCLYDLIRTMMMKQEDSKDIFEGLKHSLNPHKITVELSRRDIEDGWASLRARRR